MARLDYSALAGDFRDRVRAELSPRAADAIADLKRHLDDDAHLSPSDFAAYRHRVEQYRRSTPQDELPFGPGAA
jgi:hypothetical protein